LAQGQGQEAVPVLGRQPLGQVGAIEPGHEAGVLGQLGFGDEAEVGEQVVTCRDVLEDLDHVLGHVGPQLEERGLQAHVGHDALEVGMVGQALQGQLGSLPVPEQDVLPDGGVGGEASPVEELYRRFPVLRSEALHHESPREEES